MAVPDAIKELDELLAAAERKAVEYCRTPVTGDEPHRELLNRAGVLMSLHDVRRVIGSYYDQEKPAAEPPGPRPTGGTLPN